MTLKGVLGHRDIAERVFLEQTHRLKGGFEYLSLSVDHSPKDASAEGKLRPGIFGTEWTVVGQ